ncbi:centrosomal protein of 126 kDa isoform X2 [Mixophyes fleayi]|uniref:centrosomal protein of 126 kDa isoform X2 n=1 Tax=Mixophyes fleayi TaxID=3061075 RepID=UPI003F4E2117
MQDQRTKTYSNHKTQFEIDLEEERQALLEDQKIYRQRAQKLSVETNRRRKALEERRREEEEKEQRFREEVLHQRKLKLQEATEKFQRAHLPPSQRRRAVYTVHKRPTPKLEDALDQIQGSLSSTFYFLSNHRSTSNTRTTDTSPSLSGNSTWHIKQQPATKLSFEKIFQDRSAIQFDSNQLYFQHRLEEAQRLLEEQHLSNVQNFHQEVEQLASSESLSSLDSLEESLETVKEESNGVQEFSNDTLHKALSEIYSFTMNGGSHYTTENIGGLSSQRNPPDYPPQFIPDKMTTEKHLQVRDEGTLLRNWAQHAVTHNGISQPGNSHVSSSSNQAINHFSQVPAAESKSDYSDMSYRESTVVVRPSRAWATPDPTPTEAFQSSVPHHNKDTVQHPGLSIKPTAAQLSATPVVVLPPERSTSNCQYNVTTDLKPSKYADEIHSMNSIPVPDGLTNTYNSYNFYDHSKPAETSNLETLLHENQPSLSPIAKTESGALHEPKDHLNGSNLSQADPDKALSTLYRKAKYNSAGKERNTLPKSILKKGSKYENEYARTLGISKMFQLGEKGSNNIRDSVELTKEKEDKKTNNRKLRWLDEADKIMDDYKGVPGAIGNVQVTQKSQVDPSATVNHQEHVLASTDQAGPSTGTPNSGFSTGYHFTKQAWMMSNGEEANPVGHIHNIRSPPKAKTRIVKRPKSAKTHSAAMHQNRKGIIMRPQSATEASKIAKSQGRVMAPHPPPKPSSDNIINRETVTEARSQPTHPNNSQVNHSNAVVLSSNYILNRDPMHSQTLTRSSGNLMAAHIYNSSDLENAAKSIFTLNSERVFALQEGLTAPAKRHHVYGENGLRLDHTPTDEEIALLWQGVRSALSHKNAATGDFRPGDLPSNLQPARHNLSSLVIDGGTLNNLKSLSRTNGFFSPLANGHVTLTKRKQILDSTENKRRALLEQRRGRPGSAAWRPPHIQNVHTMKLSPFPSTHEPGQAHGAPSSGEVSESTAQFMLAEKLVETSATDGEILAAMQAKHNLLLHKATHTGHTALSLEEQRLLQSLDRLNQRLQSVQETMTKAPAATNGFPLKTPLAAENTSHSQKYRSLSADPRTRLPRRY